MWNYNTAARVNAGSDKASPDTTAETSPAKVGGTPKLPYRLVMTEVVRLVRSLQLSSLEKSHGLPCL